MLGIGKQKFYFEVSAYGKHPAFDDFFSVNMDTPLANALSSWIESGVKSGGTFEKKKTIHSFRFWILGIKKEELILGIVRDSSDRLGRTYPLLIIGRTHMKNRDQNWPTIFNDFDTIFRAFEDITARRYTAFKDFETSLVNIQFSRANFEKKGETDFSNCLMAWFEMEKGRSSLVLPVSSILDKFISKPRELEKNWVFKRKTAPPNAIFLGGLPDNPMVNIYSRPLGTNDFPRLFNLSDLNLSNHDAATGQML